MLCFIKEIAINIFLWCYFYASLRGQSGFHFTWICLLFVESCSWIFFNRIGKGSFFNIWPSVFSLGACNGNKWGREIYQDWKAFFTFNSGELYCSYAVLCECICRETGNLNFDVFLCLPYEQDQTNNQANIHVYPDWAAMQVTKIFLQVLYLLMTEILFILVSCCERFLPLIN
jgi:hypothetical protein